MARVICAGRQPGGSGGNVFGGCAYLAALDGQLDVHIPDVAAVVRRWERVGEVVSLPVEAV